MKVKPPPTFRAIPSSVLPSSQPPATPPAAAAVDKADVQRRVRKLPGQIFGSDHWWNCFALSAAKYWELAPIAEDTKKLARKYGDDLATLQRELTRLRNKNWNKLVRDPSNKEQLAWYIELQSRVDKGCAAMLPPPTENAGPEHRDNLHTLPRNLSEKKLQAIVPVLDVFEAALACRPPAETDPKKLLDALGILAARPSGRPKKELYRKGLKILLSGTYPTRPWQHICQELLPDFTRFEIIDGKKSFVLSGPDRTKQRKSMKAGIKRAAKDQGIKLP